VPFIQNGITDVVTSAVNKSCPNSILTQDLNIPVGMKLEDSLPTMMQQANCSADIKKITTLLSKVNTTVADQVMQQWLGEFKANYTMFATPTQIADSFITHVFRATNGDAMAFCADALKAMKGLFWIFFAISVVVALLNFCGATSCCCGCWSAWSLMSKKETRMVAAEVAKAGASESGGGSGQSEEQKPLITEPPAYDRANPPQQQSRPFCGLGCGRMCGRS
jgi:hypothetical protein